MSATQAVILRSGVLLGVIALLGSALLAWWLWLVWSVSVEQHQRSGYENCTGFRFTSSRQLWFHC